MNDIFIVLALLLVIVGAYLFLRLRNNGGFSYFKTEEGKGILKGIVLAIAFFLVVGTSLTVLSTNAKAQNLHQGTWVNDFSVFAGLDFTKNVSPQCEPNSVDERGTSNIGINLNIWESASKNVRVNSRYTHHSCALGRDRDAYDALGVQLEWTPWSR